MSHLLLAFDINTWILILLANISVGFLLRLIIDLGDRDHPVSHSAQRSQLRPQGYHLSYIFSGFQLQLEQGTDSLTNPNLRKYWKTILLTFPLFLASIVLTNAFKGDNVINIIAPPADQPFTNFRELYTNGFISYTKFRSMQNHRGTIQGGEFNILQGTSYGPTQTYVSEILPQQHDEIISSISDDNHNLRFYWTKERMLTLHPYLEEECPKFAVLGWIDSLRLMQEELNNFYKRQTRKSKNAPRFSLGRQIIFTQVQGWKVSHIVHDKVHRKVQNMIQFGFLDKILWYQNQSDWLSWRGNMSSPFPQGEDHANDGVKLDANMKKVFLYFILFQVILFIVRWVALVTTKLFAGFVIYMVMRSIEARYLSK